MKLLNIIYPPLAGFEIPYLAAPMLKAYCKEKGIDSIEQFDLNAEILNQLLSCDSIKKIFELFKGTELKKFQEENFVDYLNFEYLSCNLDNLKIEFRSKDINDYDYWCILKIIDIAEKLIYNYALGNTSKTKDLLEINEYLSKYFNNIDDIIVKLLEKRIDSILTNNPTKYIGISICFDTQLFYSLYLAKYIRKRNKSIKLIAGGALLQSFEDKQKEIINEYFDYFIIGEGYEKLYQILNDNVLIKTPKSIIHPKDLPCPDFSGLNLDYYLSSNLTLPIYPARGCYWNKCTFCNISQYEDAYLQKNINNVVDDMILLSRKYNCRHYYLSCDALDFNYLNKLSNMILEKKMDVSWQCETRFESGITEEMISNIANGGCWMLRFGLESASPRILESMRKGIDLNAVENILRLLSKYGIKVSIYIIANFPGETQDSIIETRNFLLKNKNYIDYIGVHLFELMNHSYIYNHPDQFDGVFFDKNGKLKYINPNIDRNTIINMYDEIISDLCRSICVGSIPSSSIKSNKFINIELIDPITLKKNNKFIYSKTIQENIPELDIFSGQNIYIHIPTGNIWTDSQGDNE